MLSASGAPLRRSHSGSSPDDEKLPNASGGCYREIAQIAVRRGDHHRVLLDEPEPRAARVEKLRGMADDEREHAVELERLVDSLYDLREGARFTRAPLGAYEQSLSHGWHQRKVGTAGS